MMALSFRSDEMSRYTENLYEAWLPQVQRALSKPTLASRVNAFRFLCGLIDCAFECADAGWLTTAETAEVQRIYEILQTEEWEATNHPIADRKDMETSDPWTSTDAALYPSHRELLIRRIRATRDDDVIRLLRFGNSKQKRTCRWRMSRAQRRAARRGSSHT